VADSQVQVLLDDARASGHGHATAAQQADKRQAWRRYHCRVYHLGRSLQMLYMHQFVSRHVKRRLNKVFANICPAHCCSRGSHVDGRLVWGRQQQHTQQRRGPFCSGHGPQKDPGCTPRAPSRPRSRGGSRPAQPRACQRCPMGCGGACCKFSTPPQWGCEHRFPASGSRGPQADDGWCSGRH
jgi:hypothetical protein